MKIKLAKSELIHFVGIGGIGMSGLALIMKGKGFKVQGSDISNNKNIERLRKEKIKVFIGHKKQNINKGTILVISSAIKKNNPELAAAKKKQLPIYKRGEMLANIVSLTKNIAELEHKNLLLSENLNFDFNDILMREKLKFGNKKEILIKLND